MLLLLFNPTVQGTIKWAGPDPRRTAYVDLETRRAVA